MKLISLLKSKIPPCVVSFIKKRICDTYNIIKEPNTQFHKLCLVSPESWDVAYYPPLYGHTKEKRIEIYSPAQYALLLDNARISANSDIVLTDKGVYWDKYNDEEFVTFAMPCDDNLVWFNRSKIGVLPFKRKQHISGTTLSMVGVWSYHWCHFFLQFASKLFYAGEAGLLDQDITILLNENIDNNIKDVVLMYLEKYPLAKICYAKPKTEYICDKLITMPATTPNFNGGKFRLDYKYIVSNLAVEKINKYVVNPIINKIKDNPVKYEKIFLTRKSSKNSARQLLNYDEIHDYFKTIGFVDIEGSDFTLEQKADIFYHAKEIVAPVGAALQNAMFCNGARCLVFINYNFVEDNCGYSEVHDKVSCWINVAGEDLSSEIHSSYYIPLDKVKKVYDGYIRQ